MKPVDKTDITIETTVHADLEKAWNYWTSPEHIVKWNFAIDEWHSPHATNDLKTGGKFNFRMEARDGSMGFDFYGTYDEIIPKQLIAYTLGDGRKARILFDEINNNSVKITETFEAENQNPVELQKGGWQAILDNFKKHVESE